MVFLFSTLILSHSSILVVTVTNRSKIASKRGRRFYSSLNDTPESNRIRPLNQFQFAVKSIYLQLKTGSEGDDGVGIH